MRGTACLSSCLPHVRASYPCSGVCASKTLVPENLNPLLRGLCTASGLLTVRSMLPDWRHLEAGLVASGQDWHPVTARGAVGQGGAGQGSGRASLPRVPSVDNGRRRNEEEEEELRVARREVARRREQVCGLQVEAI